MKRRMSGNGKDSFGRGGSLVVLALLLVASGIYLLFRMSSGEAPDLSTRNPDDTAVTPSGHKQSGEPTAPVEVSPKGVPSPSLSVSPVVDVLSPPPKKVLSGDVKPLPELFRLREVGMEFIHVEPGEFSMGSPLDEPHRRVWENLHKVTLTEGFWLGKHEVTQKEWTALDMENSSYFKGPRNPVEKVSWFDAAKFCRKLTILAGDTGQLPDGYIYRLPTEAEWEYACRAGTTTGTAFGDAMGSRQANFNGQYPCGDAAEGPFKQRTTPVGCYRANAWGFHDMHGNVWEWCHDFFAHMSKVPQVNPVPDPKVKKYRVAKGGGWLYHGWECRSTNRCAMIPSVRYNIGIGFRVALARPLTHFKKR